jgi:hypothetical protein
MVFEIQDIKDIIYENSSNLQGMGELITGRPLS